MGSHELVGQLRCEVARGDEEDEVRCRQDVARGLAYEEARAVHRMASDSVVDAPVLEEDGVERDQRYGPRDVGLVEHEPHGLVQIHPGGLVRRAARAICGCGVLLDTRGAAVVAQAKRVDVGRPYGVLADRRVVFRAESVHDRVRVVDGAVAVVHAALVGRVRHADFGGCLPLRVVRDDQQ